LKSDVAHLVAQLESGGLLVPLAKPIDDVPLGETMLAPEGQVKLVPHLLPDREGTCFVTLFTDADVLKTVGHYLEWTTSAGGDAASEDDDTSLQYCTLPARAALDLALQLIDDKEIHGLVINPSDESELILRRSEVGALAQGRAVPLIGYVHEIPYGAEDRRLVSELDAPLPSDFLAAVAECVQGIPGIASHRLQQTFNAERDLEPHPTLFIRLENESSIDHEQLNARLAAAFEGKLPAPGYIDVLFDDSAEQPR
jgi:hypothetical protein